MNKNITIGELIFDLHVPEKEGKLATFEIESTRGQLFVKVELEKALELRDLLDQYISEVERLAPPKGGPSHELYS